MNKNVVTCAPEDTLDRTAALLQEWDYGMLPVCESGAKELIGTITDRDICIHAHLENKALAQMQVADAMSEGVKACLHTDSLSQVEIIMRQARVRRVPVVDHREHLVGIISLADLAREAAREDKLERPELTLLEVGETLSKICASQLPVSAVS
jgi:predicted transcriptional regulator